MTKTHLNPHKIPLIHCEYQLKQTHPQNNGKFGTLEDWAQNLDVICTAGRSDIDSTELVKKPYTTSYQP